MVFPLPAGDWHELQMGLQPQHTVPYPVCIQHCEKSRAVVMVLSDGSCALLGVPSAGVSEGADYKLQLDAEGQSRIDQWRWCCQMGCVRSWECPQQVCRRVQVTDQRLQREAWVGWQNRCWC